MAGVGSERRVRRRADHDATGHPFSGGPPLTFSAASRSGRRPRDDRSPADGSRASTRSPRRPPAGRRGRVRRRPSIAAGLLAGNRCPPPRPVASATRDDWATVSESARAVGLCGSPDEPARGSARGEGHPVPQRAAGVPSASGRALRPGAVTLAVPTRRSGLRERDAPPPAHMRMCPLRGPPWFAPRRTPARSGTYQSEAPGPWIDGRGRSPPSRARTPPPHAAPPLRRSPVRTRGRRPQRRAPTGPRRPGPRAGGRRRGPGDGARRGRRRGRRETGRALSESPAEERRSLPRPARAGGPLRRRRRRLRRGVRQAVARDRRWGRSRPRADGRRRGAPVPR